MSPVPAPTRQALVASAVCALVRLNVDVILAPTAPSAQAAKETTTTIPIVFHTPSTIRCGPAWSRASRARVAI